MTYTPFFLYISTFCRASFVIFRMARPSSDSRLIRKLPSLSKTDKFARSQESEMAASV